MMSRDVSRAVRVAVVGLGAFGRLHALTLAGLGEAELVALVARRQASLDALAPELPHVPGYTDLDRAIDASGAEAWVVATSTASHVAVAGKLLAAGYPVLVEKPLASRAQDARALASLVRPDSSNLMMGHILLFNSEFRQLQAEMASRGPILHIACERHRPAATSARFPGETPYHLLMVHDLYCLQALMGRQEPAAFSAQARHASGGGMDLALAQLRWVDGSLATLAASYLTPEGMPADGFDRLELYGQGWAARIESNPRPLAVWDDRARSPLTLEILAGPAAPSGMLAEELRCFCRVARGAQAVPMGASYQDAIQVLDWLDKLERLAREP